MTREVEKVGVVQSRVMCYNVESLSREGEKKSAEKEIEPNNANTPDS